MKFSQLRSHPWKASRVKMSMLDSSLERIFLPQRKVQNVGMIILVNLPVIQWERKFQRFPTTFHSSVMYFYHATRKDKCWHDFMVKILDVATLQRLLRWLSWKDKCWCNLIVKTKASTTSRSNTSNSIIVSGIPVITLLHRCLSLWERQRWISLRDCWCKTWR